MSRELNRWCLHLPLIRLHFHYYIYEYTYIECHAILSFKCIWEKLSCLCFLVCYLPFRLILLWTTVDSSFPLILSIPLCSLAGVHCPLGTLAIAGFVRIQTILYMSCTHVWIYTYRFSLTLRKSKHPHQLYMIWQNPFWNDEANHSDNSLECFQ